MDSALQELRGEIGPDAILDRDADMAPHLTDWRGRFHGAARAVLLPRTVDAVAAIARWCSRHRVPIVPQGGNTGLVGGATPDARGDAVVVCTRRLDRIRALDVAEDVITVEAGCRLQDIQEHAARHGRLFPLSLAAQGSCTIGGNLATNAGGTQVLRYGTARDLALGLEVVLADGTVWQGLRTLRKDNSAYDLRGLFVGSEGTLGIITAATLRLFAPPAGRGVGLAALADLASAVALLQRARVHAGPALTAFELMSGACVELVTRTLAGRRAPFAQPHPWLVLLEWSDHRNAAAAQQGLEALGAEAIAAGEVADLVVAQSGADATALWQLRESIPEAQARQGGNVKHDIGLPVLAMAPFLAQVGPQLARLDAALQPMVFGHLGDGNLHFNVGVAAGADPARAFALEDAINGIVFGAVAALGGSISAEHGIGQLRRELVQKVKPAAERELMRSIKRALDPQGLMNPGKVL